MGEEVERLAEVLRTHDGVTRTGGGTWGCVCGHVLANERATADARHLNHVARSIGRGWLAARDAEVAARAKVEALREAALEYDACANLWKQMALSESGIRRDLVRMETFRAAAHIARARAGAAGDGWSCSICDWAGEPTVSDATPDDADRVDAWLRAHRKGNLTDHLVDAGFAQLLSLTAADHTPEHCDEDNLLAMCQGCHLHYDRDHHAETRAATRRAELEASMDPLFTEDTLL